MRHPIYLVFRRPVRDVMVSDTTKFRTRNLSNRKKLQILMFNEAEALSVVEIIRHSIQFKHTSVQ